MIGGSSVNYYFPDYGFTSSNAANLAASVPSLATTMITSRASRAKIRPFLSAMTKSTA